MELTCEVRNIIGGPVIRFLIADCVGELWINPRNQGDDDSRSAFARALGVLYYLNPYQQQKVSAQRDACISPTHTANKEMLYHFDFDGFYSSQSYEGGARVRIESQSVGCHDSVFELSYMTCSKESPLYTKSFTVRLRYRDLCRVIVRAYDKAIKRYGFIGLDKAMMESNPIVINHFLYLKAYLLNRLEWLCVETANNESRTDFVKECELLMAKL